MTSLTHEGKFLWTSSRFSQYHIKVGAKIVLHLTSLKPAIISFAAQVIKNLSHSQTKLKVTSWWRLLNSKMWDTKNCFLPLRLNDDDDSFRIIVTHCTQFTKQGAHKNSSLIFSLFFIFSGEISASFYCHRNCHCSCFCSSCIKRGFSHTQKLI